MASVKFVTLKDQSGRSVAINPANVQAIVDAGDGIIQVFFTDTHFYNFAGMLDAITEALTV